MTGDDALTTAVAELAARGVGLVEMSLHLPSLDEVFFTLTGRPVADDLEEVA